MGKPSPSEPFRNSHNDTSASVPDAAMVWLGVAVLSLDPQGVCRAVRGPAPLVGIDPDQLLGRPLDAILPGCPRLDARPQTFTAGQPAWECWASARTDQGREVWVRATSPTPRMQDLAQEVRSACHDANNTILALRCVCEGVSMTSGSSVVRADDLIEELSTAIRALSAISRTVLGLAAPHAASERS